MRETKHTTYEVRVEAGTYFLGDPCYAVPDELWMHLLDSCDFFQASSVGTVSGYQVLAFGTAYGDGQYRDNKGNSYPVDAGMIGLTPVGLINTDSTIMNPDGTRRTDLGIIVTFEHDTVCYDDGGVMAFGSYRIDTKTEDYEEDEEECVDCGDSYICHDGQCTDCCDECREDEEEN